MHNFKKVEFFINEDNKSVTAKVYVHDIGKEFIIGTYKDSLPFSTIKKSDVRSKYRFVFYDNLRDNMVHYCRFDDKGYYLSSTVTCKNQDEFDVDQGKRLARAKLYRRIYKIKRKFLTNYLLELTEVSSIVNQDLALTSSKFNKANDFLTKWRNSTYYKKGSTEVLDN